MSAARPQMTIGLTNPNTQPLTGIAFTDTYPSGIANAAAGVVTSNSCGGTVTANANGNLQCWRAARSPPARAARSSSTSSAPRPAHRSTIPDRSRARTGKPHKCKRHTQRQSIREPRRRQDRTRVGRLRRRDQLHVVVSNAGPSAANGASFSDAVPAASRLSAGAAARRPEVRRAAQSTSREQRDEYDHDVASAAASRSRSTARRRTAAPRSRTRRAIARTAGTRDPNTGNNVDSATTTLLQPQLTVSKTATPNPFIVGQPASYTITVSNTGAGSDHGPITIADTLPTGITFARRAARTGRCTGATTLSCTYTGTLAPGEHDADVERQRRGGSPRRATTTRRPTVAEIRPVRPRGVAGAPSSLRSRLGRHRGQQDRGQQHAERRRERDVHDRGHRTTARAMRRASRSPTHCRRDSPSSIRLCHRRARTTTATGLVERRRTCRRATARRSISSATVLVPGTLTNTATRSGGDQFDPDPSNNASSASINAQPTADLRVAKTVDNATPNLGTNVDLHDRADQRGAR